MTKHMVRELINILTKQNILETGRRINNTAMALKFGLMDQNTKEIMSKAKSTELEISDGLTSQTT